jgi:hypothetical protein
VLIKNGIAISMDGKDLARQHLRRAAFGAASKIIFVAACQGTFSAAC